MSTTAVGDRYVTVVCDGGGRWSVCLWRVVDRGKVGALERYSFEKETDAHRSAKSLALARGVALVPTWLTA